MRLFSFVVFWFSLGTHLCAQWQPIGPFGGAVAAIQTDSRHPDTVLAATGNALLFRSSDGGDHWSSVPFPPALHAILHLFVVQPDGAYLAGLGSDSPAYSGLFRSRDEGVTWEHIEGLAGREIWSLAIWAADPRVIAAGSRDGVYLTRDGGATWKRISPLENRELQPVVSLAFDPADANVVFAGTPHLPWKTRDGGASWHSIHAGMIDDSDVFSIQVDHNLPQHVFATACSGIYSSTNGGGLWTKLTGATGASYRTYTVSQDPRQSNVVFAGTTGGLIRSYDNGRTWRKLSGDAARFIAFDPARPGRIFVATDQQGVLRSDDNGDSLKGVNEGLCNRYFSSLAAAGGDLFTASIYEPSAGGVFRLKGDGVEWERVAAPSALAGEQILNLAAGSDAGGKGLYATTYRSILASSDAGKTWKRIPGPTG
ncbi:MAG: hypothetical protein JWO80_6527, partial [Bryobacterales bacterium]|nr:hypothetical protein [Bryobacterales bacterium]